MTCRPLTGLLVGLLLWSGSASPTAAQAPASSPAQPQPPPQPPPPVEAEAQEAQKYEEEVIVSASRTEQALVNAPATVTLIDSRAIENSPATKGCV